MRNTSSCGASPRARKIFSAVRTSRTPWARRASAHTAPRSEPITGARGREGARAGNSKRQGQQRDEDQGERRHELAHPDQQRPAPTRALHRMITTTAQPPLAAYPRPPVLLTPDAARPPPVRHKLHVTGTLLSTRQCAGHGTPDPSPTRLPDKKQGQLPANRELRGQVRCHEQAPSRGSRRGENGRLQDTTSGETEVSRTDPTDRLPKTKNTSPLSSQRQLSDLQQGFSARLEHKAPATG